MPLASNWRVSPSSSTVGTLPSLARRTTATRNWVWAKPSASRAIAAASASAAAAFERAPDSRALAAPDCGQQAGRLGQPPVTLAFQVAQPSGLVRHPPAVLDHAASSSP